MTVLQGIAEGAVYVFVKRLEFAFVVCLVVHCELPIGFV